jgi:hypothetical protein
MSPTGPGAQPDNFDRGDKTAHPTSIPYETMSNGRRMPNDGTYHVHTHGCWEAHNDALSNVG